MTNGKSGMLIRAGLLALAIASIPGTKANTLGEAPAEDSTITYTADFFAEFSPVSANDMISRIPGVGLAMRGGNRGRGLGSGEGEILINGQRIAGKNNSGNSQLSRISADQVQHIEIIRGTSEELNVRGGGQVINIVLLDSPSRSSTAVEVNMDRYRDSTIAPGGRVSLSGQSGSFNYLFHLQAEPRYNNQESSEIGYNPDFAISETRFSESTYDQLEYQTSMNLGYQFENSVVQFNALYEASEPPSNTDRTINDLVTNTVIVEREQRANDRSNWEIGGDYEYGFATGARFRFLAIINDRLRESTRERFQVLPDAENIDLFLFNSGRDRERIARSSYIWDLNENQAMEIGIERAQTIRDSGLLMGLDTDGTPSASVSGLVPVSIDNANSTVEELRYETFAVHNWQLSDRMSLESSLIFESSTITQSGDVRNERDFNFLRPKLDYRFDITPSLQLRASIEKDISQLSFSDFSATVDNSDDDQNTIAGNPEIAQEQSWRYGLNLEYRLPNNVGVLNSRFFYRDIEDVIGRVDVSPSPTDLRSARGNIGDGKRYGLNLDASTQLGFLGLPNALLTTGFSVGDSEVVDPFLGTTRRMQNNNRWFGRMGFRHDVPAYNLSYGFDYSAPSNGGSGRTQIDINDTERQKNDPDLSTFIEARAFGDITFRFETRNTLNSQYCRTRTRFNGTTAGGSIEEIEDFCSNNGVQLAFKVRTTF